MTELAAPPVALGGLAMAMALLYAAWHEYKQENERDAKLLVCTGAVSLMGTAAMWLL